MRTYGEAGTVKIGINGKVLARDTGMIFAGYPSNCAGNYYRIFTPKTRKCVEVCDIMWLHRMYYPRSDTDLTLQDSVVFLETLSESNTYKASEEWDNNKPDDKVSDLQEIDPDGR